MFKFFFGVIVGIVLSFFYLLNTDQCSTISIKLDKTVSSNVQLPVIQLEKQ
jgi:hypothetical protein